MSWNTQLVKLLFHVEQLPHGGFARWAPEGVFLPIDEQFYIGKPEFVGKIPTRKDVLVVPKGCFLPEDESDVHE